MNCGTAEALNGLWKVICLSLSRGTGITAKELGALFQAAETQDASTLEELLELCVHGPVREALRGEVQSGSCAAEIDALRAEGIELVGLVEADYPALLRHIYEPPLVLFYKGSKTCLTHPACLAIVGSRNGDATGCQIARDFAAELARCGLLVVSGLAAGIDGAAHRGALSAQVALPTAAILGNGLRQVYPRSNARLAEDIIAAGGVLVSQFGPDEKPYPSNFLNRNRVIAGMSQAVLVVQAAARSGSLVTARYALEEGREVMAIPGGILDPRYEGTNRLLREGAQLIRSVDDILEMFPEHARTAPAVGNAAALQGVEGELLTFLRNAGPTPLACVIDKFARTPGLHEKLLELELRGVLHRAPGNVLIAADAAP